MAEPTCEKCWAGRHARCQEPGVCGCIDCGGKGYTAGTPSVLSRPSVPRVPAPRKPRAPRTTRPSVRAGSGTVAGSRPAHRPKGSGRTYEDETVRECIRLREQQGYSWTQVAAHFGLPSYEGLRWAVIHYFEDKKKANA